MSRSIRRVPGDWKHPTMPNGKFQPMFDIFYSDAVDDWNYNNELWSKGEHPDQIQFESVKEYTSYDQYHSYPDPSFYIQGNKDTFKRTHYQVYETVSEGTPKSPVFETEGQVKEWLLSIGNSSDAADYLIQIGSTGSFTGTMNKDGLKLTPPIITEPIEGES